MGFRLKILSILQIILVVFLSIGIPVQCTAEQYSNDSCPISVYFYEDNGKIGIKDTEDNILIDPTYDEVSIWIEDSVLELTYAHIWKDGLCGIVCSDGYVISEPEWEWIIAPSNKGKFHVMKNGQWGLLDKEGRLLFEVEYQNPVYYYEEYQLAIIHEMDPETGMAKYGLINSKGETIIKPIYDGLEGITEDRLFYWDCSLEKWGILDLDGNMITPPLYSGRGSRAFSNGYAEVYQDDLGGYIDIYGNTVIPFEYAYVGIFDGNYALVQKDIDGKYGIIDKNGEYVVEPVINHAYLWDKETHTYCFFEDAGSENYKILSLEEAVELYSIT